MLTVEVKAEAVREALEEPRLGLLLINGWSVAEFSSAIGIKIRSRQIDEAQGVAALTCLNGMIGETLARLALQPTHYDHAASMMREHRLGLRAGDALHLAAAQAFGSAVLTLDRRMAEAGQSLGLDTRLLE